MKIYPEGIRAYFAANTASLRTRATLSTYRQRLTELHQHAGGKDVRRFTEADLAAYCQSGNPAPRTVSLRRTVCRQFFRWAHRAGHCPTDVGLYLNDAVKVRSKTVRAANWLTEGQVKELVNGCPDDLLGRRDRIALLLGFQTGLRAQEICNLRWQHVDLAARRLAVVGKGEKAATLGLTQGLSAALVAWAPECGPGAVVPRLRKVWDRGHAGHVFELYGDNPLTVSGLQQALKRHGPRIGVPGLAPHDMRRSLAGILQAKGFSIEQISEVLRHDNIATTQAYLKKNPHGAIDTLQALELDI